MNKDSVINATPRFHIRDCTLVMLATGKHAQNLKEFRDCLQDVHPDSVYHHFWGRLLQPRFDEPEYNNDFASWANHGLHDKILAERLSVVDPTDSEDIEGLRNEVLEVVEDRLDEKEFIPWASADQQFHFIKSQIIVLDTGVEIDTPDELAEAIKSMTSGSIFYHFIDGRRRNPQHCDDFSDWLNKLGTAYEHTKSQISDIDPYFSSLRWLRHQIIEILSGNGNGVLDE